MRLCRMIVAGLLSLSVIAASAAARAASAEPTSSQLNELLELSGASTQLEQLPAHMGGGWDRLRQLDAETADRIEPIFRAAFHPDKVRPLVAAYLTSHVSSEEATQYVLLLRTPIARRMSALEDRLASPESLREALAYLENADSMAAAVERIGVIQRLEAAARTTDSQARLLSDVTIAMVKSMAAAFPPEQRGSEAEIDSARAQIETNARAQLADMNLGLMLYIYRSATDAELEQYIELLESPPAPAMTRHLSDAFASAIEAVGSEAGIQAGKVIAERGAELRGAPTK